METMAVGATMNDRTRLRCDSDFLIRSMVQELQKYDHEGTEEVSAAAFSRVLEDLGLRYGSKEVDNVLNLCKMGHDGFLNYGSLMKAAGIGSDVSNTINTDEREPENENTNGTAELEAQSLRLDPMAMKTLMAESSGSIRSLYSEWDRGLITGPVFIKQVERMGVPITPEFRDVVLKSGQSLGITFRDVIKALHVGANLADSEHIRAAEKPDRVTYTIGADLISWREDCKGNPYTSADRLTMAKALLADFVDGKSHEANVRRSLLEAGFTLSPEFDRLMMKAKNGTANAFRDLVLCLRRENQAIPQEPGTVEPSVDGTINPEAEAGDKWRLVAPFGTDLPHTDEEVLAAGYGSSLEPSCMVHGVKASLRRPQSPDRPNRNTGDLISWREDFGANKFEQTQNVINSLHAKIPTIEEPDAQAGAEVNTEKVNSRKDEIEAGYSVASNGGMADILSQSTKRDDSSSKTGSLPYRVSRAPFAVDEEPINKKY